MLAQMRFCFILVTVARERRSARRMSNGSLFINWPPWDVFGTIYRYCIGGCPRSAAPDGRITPARPGGPATRATPRDVSGAEQGRGRGCSDDERRQHAALDDQHRLIQP